MSAGHWSGYRKPERPVRLTSRQRDAKWLFCLLVSVGLGVLALWSGLWLVAGLADGVVSLGHLALLVFALMMGPVFMDIGEHA